MPDYDETGLHHPDDEEFTVSVRRVNRAPSGGLGHAAPRRRATDIAAQAVAAAISPPAPAQVPHLPPPATPHPDPIRHILPHGSIATLSGASGVGKTAFTAGFIRDLQQGRPFFGHPTTPPAGIGYVAADRPWRDHAAWFKRAGCADFAFYSLRDDRSFNWDRFRDWKQCGPIFCEVLDKLALPPGALVIVDPLPLFIPGRLIDYKDMAVGMATLDTNGLQPRQLTMLGVFHIAKQKGSAKDRYLRPQDRILGSGGQIGYSETAMYLMGPDELDADHYLCGWVPHQIPAEAHKLKRDADGLFTVAEDLDLILSVEAADAAIPRADGQTYTTAMITSVIAKATGASQRSAERYLKELTRQGRWESVGRGKWRRPESAAGAAVAH